MKKIKLLALAAILFGCQQAELLDPTEVNQSLKTVTISAGMNAPNTKAAIDSETGSVTWQKGDVISVLATDGKFHSFTLKEGAGSNIAEFEGQLPKEHSITTVATYPGFVEDGADNTILTDNTLAYNLPAEWTYSHYTSNVPLVATMGEAAEYLSFKQVGGVIRFPVRNLPANAVFEIAMADKTITGDFPVDITALGESAMVAGTEASTVVLNYTSEYPALYAEINVPVPTGVYNNFTLTIKVPAAVEATSDESTETPSEEPEVEYTTVFTKNYTSDKNVVNRATLLIMSEIVLDELPVLPVADAEVWPFFVDARVIFPKAENLTQYAAYIDGSETPVIYDAEDWGDKAAILFGGEFAHGTTHTVAVAKVVNGVVLPETKSAELTFKTADMRQLTNNTGTRFVAVGWDDVTIANAPVWDPAKKRYSLIPFEGNQDKRGYKVQLYAADKTTVLYDLYTFDSHNWFEGTFCSEVNFGRVNNVNAASPTALTFCWLEPGQDYYFRVKALDETVYLDNTNGNYNPDGTADPTKPVPYPLSSERGGCAWSDFIKLSTDPAHVPSENEILYEGFDDLLIHMDLANWSHVVVPDFATEYKAMSKDEYQATLAEDYKAFFKNPDVANTKFFIQQYGSEFTAELFGMFDEDYESGKPRHFNEYAGGLKGWSHTSSRNKSGDQLRPGVGIAFMGRGATYKDSAPLYTPAFNSNKLEYDIATKCIVTINVTPWLGSSVDNASAIKEFKVSVIRDGGFVQNYTKSIYESDVDKAKWDDAIQFTSKTDYVRYFPFYELQFEVYLKNGDQLCFDRAVAAQKGAIGFDDIKVEVVPGAYEGDEVNPEDSGIGTAPDDNINYDVYGLGEFPISYFYGPPTAFYTKYDATTGAPYYDYDLTKATYQDVKDAGFNIAIYGGEVDHALAENVRIAGICQEVGLKFMSGLSHYTTTDIEEVKKTLYTFDNYLGDYISDEPSAAEFDALGDYTKRFLEAMPDKDVYINLYPNRASVTQKGTQTLEEYVDLYLEKVPTKAVSWDEYSLIDKHDFRYDHYFNADLYRYKTLQARKPYWSIVASGAIGKATLDPTEEELRFSVLANVALGSKGISYFTYYTPGEGADVWPKEFIITRDGTKRDIYYWIQEFNADIKTIGKKLLYCHADGAIHTTVSHPLYANSGIGRTKYGPIKQVKMNSASQSSVMVGCFRDARTAENGPNYKGYKALVMAKIQNFNVVGDLTLDPSVTKATFTHNNTSETLDLTTGLDTKVGDIKVAYVNGILTLSIPSGEAVLVEF